MKKTYYILTTLVLGTFLIGCGGNKTSDKQLSGKDIFAKRCVACHGADGKAGISGAKDLSASTIDDNMARVIITHGKGSMPPFKTILEAGEIELLIKHIQTLKK